MVSNLGQPGISKMGGAAWLLLQLCVGQCACWRWMLEIDAVAIKNLMSGTYIMISKANCLALTIAAFDNFFQLYT